MLKQLRYWWFLRQNGYPHKGEISQCLASIKHHISPRIHAAASMYAYGSSLEYIADRQGVTRERIRMYLLKVRRMSQPDWPPDYS